MARVLIVFVAAVFLVVSTVSYLAVSRKILARGPSYEPERSHWGHGHMRTRIVVDDGRERGEIGYSTTERRR